MEGPSPLIYKDGPRPMRHGNIVKGKTPGGLNSPPARICTCVLSVAKNQFWEFTCEFFHLCAILSGTASWLAYANRPVAALDLRSYLPDPRFFCFCILYRKRCVRYHIVYASWRRRVYQAQFDYLHRGRLGRWYAYELWLWKPLTTLGDSALPAAGLQGPGIRFYTFIYFPLSCGWRSPELTAPVETCNNSLQYNWFSSLEWLGLAFPVSQPAIARVHFHKILQCNQVRKSYWSYDL